MTRVIIRVKLIRQNFAYALIIRVRLITIFPKKQELVKLECALNKKNHGNICYSFVILSIAIRLIDAVIKFVHYTTCSSVV